MRAALLAALAATALAASAATAPAAGPADVVISQVWGGSPSDIGVSGLPKADFVELRNRSAQAVPLAGWSVAVSAFGSAPSWARIPLAGSIPAGGYYLVRLHNALPIGVNLPAADAAGSTTALTAGQGKVVLLDATAPATLSGACPSAGVVDRVVYGADGTCAEGSPGPAGSASGAGLALLRRDGGCADTDVNASDFATAAPAPRNSSSPPPGACALTACCLPGGACAITTAGSCAGGGGSARGGGSCSPSPCALGACCDALTGACTAGASGACAGAFLGAGTTCDPSPCPPSGACCTPEGACLPRTPAACTGDLQYLGDGSACGAGACGVGACCLPAGHCCTLTPHACAVYGGLAAAPGVPCHAPGDCQSPPPNDGCATPTALSLGVPVTGSLFAATPDGDGPPPAHASTAMTAAVWFRFVAPAAGPYDVSACGTSFDADLQVFRVGDCADTATWARAGSDADACSGGEAGVCSAAGTGAAPAINGLGLSAGVAYHVRLSAGAGAARGNYRVGVFAAAGAVGACCVALTGECQARTQAACAAASPPAAYGGDGVACGPAACPAAAGAGACCVQPGVCVPRTGASCAPGLFLGPGAACAPDPCAPPASDECIRAAPLPLGVPLAGTTANATASAGAPTCTIAALDVYAAFTAPLDAQYRFTLTPAGGALSLAVWPGDCPPPLSPAFCGPASASPTSAPPTFLAAGTTVRLRVASIQGASAFTLRADAPGLSPCCRGATCAPPDGPACVPGPGGRAGAAPGAAGPCPGACCPQDYNKQNSVELLDIFDYLADWFDGSPLTNFNGDGVASGDLLDLFGFLAAWFSGPCG